MSHISQIQTAIMGLGNADILQVEDFISQLIHQKSLEISMQKRSDQIVQSSCIHCGFRKLLKWGRSKAGTQRFKCRNCKATFGATTGTSLYRLRNRHLWSKYLGLMNRHLPLKALPEYGIGLSLPTLHRWRHRFLSVMVANPETKLAGRIEADEKFFRTSFKGSRGWKLREPPQDRLARKRGVASQRGLGEEQVPILTVLDRSGAICQAKLPNTKWASITKEMNPWIEPDSMICSDSNAVYARVASQTGCEHMVAKKGNGNAGGLSIGRIDSYHRDVENLINRRCMGVGTRYLMNYFGWQRRIRQHKPFGDELLGELMGK